MDMKMESEVVKEKIHTEPMLNDPRYITLLSVIVLILTLLFWWFYSRRHQVRRSVLLTGLSESGKTLLFVQLAYSQYRQTFTSIRENVEDYFVGSKALKIVDIPGQERLRNKFFEKYRKSAKAIVYVVDSAAIQKEIRDVAEYLYTILSDPVVQSNSPPVLILCNKQDQPLAKGGQAIKTLLEKEINLVRTTKSAQLESVGGSQQSTISVGRAGKDFEFSQLSSRVDVAECAALTEQTEDAASDADGIVPLKDWIARL